MERTTSHLGQVYWQGLKNQERSEKPEIINKESQQKISESETKS